MGAICHLAQLIMNTLLQLPFNTQILGALFCMTMLLAWSSKCITFREYKIPLWSLIYAPTLSVAYVFESINMIGLLWILILAITCTVHTKKYYPIISYSVLLILPFLLATHSLPGFNNVLLFKDAEISKDAISYSRFLNIDKISAGLFLFWFLFTNDQRQVFKRSIIKLALPVAIVTIVVTLALANISLIHIDIKLSQYLLLFIISNVLLTCMTEEAYFRGVIQNKLQLKNTYLAIIVSAVLFGLAHFGAGRLDYVLISMVAGLGYATVYHRTGSISASILTHATLNIIHFVFFTYPFAH